MLSTRADVKFTLLGVERPQPEVCGVPPNVVMQLHATRTKPSFGTSRATGLISQDGSSPFHYHPLPSRASCALPSREDSLSRTTPRPL